MVKKVSNMTYRLHLLERLKVYPTFYVSFLKPYHEYVDPSRMQMYHAPPIVRQQFNKEMERILDHRNIGTK